MRRTKKRYISSFVRGTRYAAAALGGVAGGRYSCARAVRSQDLAPKRSECRPSRPPRPPRVNTHAAHNAPRTEHHAAERGTACVRAGRRPRPAWHAVRRTRFGIGWAAMNCAYYQHGDTHPAPHNANNTYFNEGSGRAAPKPGRPGLNESPAIIKNAPN
ncbi:unnamed protein product, partial [Iphiclides podalirius]